MSDKFGFASGANLDFLETMYEKYKQDPQSVEKSWQSFFAGYEFALENSPKSSKAESQTSTHWSKDDAKVEAFINAYRSIAYMYADINPLKEKDASPYVLSPQSHGLVNIDEERLFHPSNFGNKAMTFKDIHRKLEITYRQKIGADFRDMNDIEKITWLQKQMESTTNCPDLAKDVRAKILNKLIQAEGFEKFLQARYLGQKRFSLEGLETLIPLMDHLITESCDHGVDEVCVGMAHRGRLNILANIMGKPLEDILKEFEGSEANPFDIDGDVKYHLGYANQVKTSQGKESRLYLSPNPSHLEAVNPVLEGFVRCRQENYGGVKKILPVLLHGDAAFIGQGIVAETLNLSQLDHYSTGGTIHIISNNQIGFTTNPDDSRSCSYSSDISKLVRAPVFHVNADDPEAVVWTAQLALMFRNKFHHDVVIDLIGYRRHGHNETDEPTFTQPDLYKKISKHKTVLEKYIDNLQEKRVFSSEEISLWKKEYKDLLQHTYEKVRTQKKVRVKTKKEKKPVPKLFEHIFAYKQISRKDYLKAIPTAVKPSVLRKVSEIITFIPPTFKAHKKIQRVFETRQNMYQGKQGVDWGASELLAFATLSEEGFSIRLSGQDCQRGTFSSRHAVIFDQNTGEKYEPLKNLKSTRVNIINSPLSELGCLGYEFGYSVAAERSLVLWEAQFGDFVNGAQIVIDQFLSSSEAKWQQTSNLVLLLPHGYEGQGPEHSSARPERFLQSCGNLNIQVCYPSTSAQYFHLLRRQYLSSYRKPLIVFTPKSLLRSQEVSSSISEFSKGQFAPIISDTKVGDNLKIKNLILCSGKIYYELKSKKNSNEHLNDSAIVRLEQFYPFPKEKLLDVIKKYKNLEKVIWTQEEPQNMGGWNFILPRIQELLPQGLKLEYNGRKHSGSTAEGAGKSHTLEQARIVDQAFSLVCAWKPNMHE